MRFCTGCQAHRSEEGGITRRARKTARWMCKACAEKKTESIYKATSGRACNVQKLMTSLYEKASSGD